MSAMELPSIPYLHFAERRAAALYSRWRQFTPFYRGCCYGMALALFCFKDTERCHERMPRDYRHGKEYLFEEMRDITKFVVWLDALQRAIEETEREISEDAARVKRMVTA